MNTFSRRSLLSGLSRLAAASAFAPMLEAVASPGPFVQPRNLLVLFHPNGFEPGWKPELVNGAFSLGPTLGALEPFKSRLLVSHGLRAGIRNEVAAHSEGMTSMFTGAQIAKGDAFSAAPSFDQLIAEKLAGTAPLSSLELGVQSQVGFGAGGNSSVMIYSRSGKLQPEDDPNAAFRRLFGAAAAPAELDRVQAERRSVLDLVRGDLSKVRALAGADAAQKLDAHAEGLRRLETRLSELSSLQCDREFTRHTFTNSQLDAHEKFPALAELQAELAVLALKCGVTRVVSLQYANSVTDRRFPGVNPTNGVHTVMHMGTRAEKVAINRYFVGLAAGVLGKLDAVKRADGSSLLDETLVVWGSEMAIGNHLRDPVPFIVAGGSRPNEGYFHQGRVIDASGQRTTRVLVSALHAFGLSTVTSLGDLTDETSRGPLPGASRVS
ncbi:MAG: DUF1552 domain-containing protein [Archangium sp.]|nr:DUF1552 domain-containing protein [Archangium sp.]